MDKPAVESLQNQGGVVLAIGGLLLQIGEPLSRGIKPEPIQLIGYGVLFAGIIMVIVGNRRATSKLINKVEELSVQVEEGSRTLEGNNKTLLNNKLALDTIQMSTSLANGGNGGNGGNNGNNGHNIDDGPKSLL